MTLIKRYLNRKLYDTQARRYITLDRIAGLIRQGIDVRIIDHQTGNDLTAITLAQVIAGQEKRRSGSVPRSILTELIASRLEMAANFTHIGADQIEQIFQKKNIPTREDIERLHEQLDALNDQLDSLAGARE